MNLKTTIYSITVLLILSLAACKKGPNPYITLQELKKKDSLLHPVVGGAAFIYKKNIYYVADFTKTPVKVTKDSSAVKFVKISHDHTKYAYQNAGGIIVVIDSQGNTIATLSQYTSVKSFDWSADDKTLYILNNNDMAYYGPSMNLPAITFEGIKNGSTGEVLSASVSVKGDFAYVIHGYNIIDGDKYIMIVKPANSSTFVKFQDNDTVYPMDYVSFSSNKQDLLLGYKALHNGSDSQEKISIFTNLNPLPDFSYGGNGVANVCTPVYKSNLNNMVTGYVTSSGSNSFIAPASISLSGDTSKNKVLKTFIVNGDNLYTDWK